MASPPPCCLSQPLRLLCAPRWLMVATICLLGLAPQALGQRLRIVVGAPDFRPMPVAAPAFEITDPEATLAQFAQELTSYAQEGIDQTRSLALVPPSSYLTGPSDTLAKPNFPSWQQVGATGLLKGLVERKGPHMALTLRLYDVASTHVLWEQRCQVAMADTRRCIDKFLDSAVGELTGEQGIFSSRIAVVRQDGPHKGIYITDPHGHQLSPLWTTPALHLLPAWDPLGTFVYFTTYQQGPAETARIAYPLGKSLEYVSQEPGLNMGAVIAPDNQAMAITLSRDGSTEIYWRHLPNGMDKRQVLRRLTDSFGQDVSPSFSPDGKQLVFVSSRSGQPHLYIMPVQGGAPKRITFRGTYNQEPDWSPRAGGKIVFTARDEHYKYDIFLVDPMTTEITRLTQDESHNESPSFSPDGHHIVFTSTRGPSKQKRLWIMDVDGQHQRPLPLPPGAYETPAWGPRLGYKDLVDLTLAPANK